MSANLPAANAPSRRRLLIFGPTLLIAIAVVTSVGLPLWQRHHARALFDAHVALLRSRGEPVTFADLAPATIPDAQNAVFFINRAAANLRCTDEEEHAISTLFDVNPPPPDALQAVAPILAARPAVFDDLAAARQCPVLNWDIRAAPDPIDTPLPHLNRCRELSGFLAAAAFLEHGRGADATAVEHLRTVLFLARAADQGTLVCHLCALGITGAAADRARTLAASLQIGNSPPAATPDQVRSLINEFLDEQARRDAIVRAWQWERANSIAAAQFVGSQKFWARATLDRAAVMMSNDCDALRNASLAPNHPAAVPLLPARSGGSSLDVSLRDIMIPSFRRAVATEFRALADRRAAATALAIRLYAAEHAGKLAPDLGALVPKYLPQLRADPFAPDNRPLAYRTTTSPTLYSVGENATDDGGKDRLDGTPPDQPLNPWTAPDAVFPLTKPAPPPAARPAS
jgi:hypothetical protein